jgi:hypothetical protein
MDIVVWCIGAGVVYLLFTNVILNLQFASFVKSQDSSGNNDFVGKPSPHYADTINGAPTNDMVTISGKGNGRFDVSVISRQEPEMPSGQWV